VTKKGSYYALPGKQNNKEGPPEEKTLSHTRIIGGVEEWSKCERGYDWGQCLSKKAIGIGVNFHLKEMNSHESGIVELLVYRKNGEMDRRGQSRCIHGEESTTGVLRLWGKGGRNR